MSKEIQYPTNIEKEQKFIQWCQKSGVKRFLFDLDDTICPTREVFISVMSQAYDYLAINTTLNSKEKWRDEIETTNNRLFELHGVNSNRWNYLVDELTKRYSLGENINYTTKQIFQTIYSTPLKMSEGADEGLEFIKNVDLPMGIVTHAGQEWTWKKYEWLELNRFMNWDDIYIVDENKHKTSESWSDAIKYFGLKSKECAVVGDSPRSDINPAWNIGVRHCFLLEDPRQWILHNQPVDASVKRIRNLKEIPDVVLEHNKI
jgi:FMN phosphatase YigB (HAD superfamily)